MVVGGNRKRGKGCLVTFICLVFKYCLVLRRKPEDTEEILPCSFISNPLIISETEDWDSRRILEVFMLHMRVISYSVTFEKLELSFLINIFPFIT